MAQAFTDWTPQQKIEVRKYVDKFSSLTDAQMVDQIKTQRAVGYWHVAVEVTAGQAARDCDQFLLDRFSEYLVTEKDKAIDIAIKINIYISGLVTDALRVSALAKVSEFWESYRNAGHIRAIRKKIKHVVNSIVEDDIVKIRAL